MIVLEKMGLQYKTPNGLFTALNDITLNITPGEKVVVFGESGSGKSSLLNIIGLIETNYSGSCRLNNEESKKAPAAGGQDSEIRISDLCSRIIICLNRKRCLKTSGFRFITREYPTTGTEG